MRSKTAPRRVTDHASRSTEKLLAAIWQRRWLDSGPLVDSLGREVRVVYPGRRWGGPGPDFQGAVLALDDGTLLRGDVEVHLRAADWRAHGHDRDPAYNRTALHVVLHTSGRPSARQDGAPLPVLELAAHLAEPLPVLAARLLDAPDSVSDDLACLDSAADLARLVDRAALERFGDKAASFEADLAVFRLAEVLYRASLIALGYSANKDPCARLGELVPWALIQRLGREREGEASIRALLLGAAGLLPSQRGLPVAPGEPRHLETLWSALAPELGRRPLSPTVWRLVGVRPENTPARRLAGAAALFGAWLDDDAIPALFEAVGAQDCPLSALADRFRARSAEPFWARHFDFDAPTVGARPWQIGRPRAAEIVVNVLLPLAHALGSATERPDLAAAALLSYRALPAGPWNRVTRAMAAQLFGPPGARLCAGAARQQGLLHLYKRWCWERRCDACPAGERRRARVEGRAILATSAP